MMVTAMGPGSTKRWQTPVSIDPSWAPRHHLVEHGDAVVAVFFHGSASGSTAVILDREDGSVRWSGPPGNIGSIGHSKYSNRVRVVPAGDGAVRVYGDESGGRYVGLLDLREGLWGHEAWR